MKMDNLEKVEKLRERANVSYEEARTALEENNWDLLDAMVALEKAGKTRSPRQEQYSTSYDQQEEYIPVIEKVKEQEERQPRPGKTIGGAIRRFFAICRDNSFCISRNDSNVIRLPLIAAVVILFFSWRITIPVMLIALLFGFRYSFEGKDDLKQANAFMQSASSAAESLKEGFANSSNAGSKNADAANAGAESSAAADTANTVVENSAAANTVVESSSAAGAASAGSSENN